MYGVSVTLLDQEAYRNKNHTTPSIALKPIFKDQEKYFIYFEMLVDILDQEWQRTIPLIVYEFYAWLLMQSLHLLLWSLFLDDQEIKINCFEMQIDPKTKNDDR